LNLFFIRNAVHYLLVAPPGRLQVRRVCDCVFRVRVSCQNVANVLVVQGCLSLGSSVLLLHSSMAAAVRHARSLPQWEVAAVNAQPPEVSSLQQGAGHHGLNSTLRWGRDTSVVSAIRLRPMLAAMPRERRERCLPRRELMHVLSPAAQHCPRSGCSAHAC
jgi:hypothetical protein